MNRAALRHLRAVVDRRAMPLYIIRAHCVPDNERALLRAIREMSSGASVVLPSSVTCEVAAPRFAVRPVAGKGARRRGLRRDEPFVSAQEPTR